VNFIELVKREIEKNDIILCMTKYRDPRNLIDCRRAVRIHQHHHYFPSSGRTLMCFRRARERFSQLLPALNFLVNSW
jgi:hypothetical protein